MGCQRIVALRGDLPSGMARMPATSATPPTWSSSSAREHGGYFHIEVGCYPGDASAGRGRARRPAPLQGQGRRRRRRRDHAVLLQRRRLFPLRRRRAQARASTIPIVPGIMPISNFTPAQALLRSLRRRDPALDRQAHAGLRRRRRSDPRVRRRPGRRLCRRLIDGGAPELHFYTLNLAKPTRGGARAAVARAGESIRRMRFRRAIAAAATACVARCAPSATSAPPSARAASSGHADVRRAASQPPLIARCSTGDGSRSPPLRPGSPRASGTGCASCTAADGVPVFTDRRCEDVGAHATSVQRAASRRHRRCGRCARAAARARSGRPARRRARARSRTRDANRLADYYHWTGMCDAAGLPADRAARRASAQRPLVDVQPVRPRDRGCRSPTSSSVLDEIPPTARPRPKSPTRRADRGRPHAAAAHGRGWPAMLRVDQMRSDQRRRFDASRYFRLLTNAGCWWIAALSPGAQVKWRASSHAEPRSPT